MDLYSRCGDRDLSESTEEVLYRERRRHKKNTLQMLIWVRNMLNFVITDCCGIRSKSVCVIWYSSFCGFSHYFLHWKKHCIFLVWSGNGSIERPNHISASTKISEWHSEIVVPRSFLNPSALNCSYFQHEYSVFFLDPFHRVMFKSAPLFYASHQFKLHECNLSSWLLFLRCDPPLRQLCTSFQHCSLDSQRKSE